MMHEREIEARIWSDMMIQWCRELRPQLWIPTIGLTLITLRLIDVAERLSVERGWGMMWLLVLLSIGCTLTAGCVAIAKSRW